MGHSINYTISYNYTTILEALRFIFVLLICNYLFHTNLCKFEDIQQYCQDSYCEVNKEKKKEKHTDRPSKIEHCIGLDKGINMHIQSKLL